MHQLLWSLTIVLIGCLAYPIAKKVGVPYLSNVIGIVIFAYITWLISNFTCFKTAVIIAFLIYIATLLPLTLKDPPKEIVRLEILTLFFFYLYVVYVLFNPYIFGGEKLMDVSVLTSIMRAKGMPPPDPNISGFRFDCYYYMGYIPIAAIATLTKTQPGVAYNLGLATVFTLTVSTAVEFSIRTKRWYLPLFLLAGNLCTIALLFLNPSKAFDFWAVTRVIPGTINEFPFATLTFRDLHPHLLDIPFELATLAALYEYYRRPKRSTAAVISMLIWFMATVNTWELPTYLALSAVIVRLEDIPTLAAFAIPFAPYLLKLHPYAVKGIGIVRYRTEIPYFIAAQPLYLIPLAVSFKRDWKLFTATLLAVLPFAYLFKFQLLLLTVPVIAVLLLRGERGFDERLILIVSLLFLAVEVFYVNDPYTGRIERLNTVFKTYEQAWIILSFACSGLRLDKRFLIPFLAILWLYPIGYLSTLHYVGTINGMAYTARYGEFYALRYLQMCPNGVLLEYPGRTPFSSYTYSSRVSSFTGLSAVLVRGGHELFWRYYWKGDIARLLYKRWRDVERMYRGNLSVMRRYNVKYVYYGYLERLHYRQRFKRLSLIYDDGLVKIYLTPWSN